MIVSSSGTVASVVPEGCRGVVSAASPTSEMQPWQTAFLSCLTVVEIGRALKQDKVKEAADLNLGHLIWGWDGGGQKKRPCWGRKVPAFLHGDSEEPWLPPPPQYLLGAGNASTSQFQGCSSGPGRMGVPLQVSWDDEEGDPNAGGLSRWGPHVQPPGGRDTGHTGGHRTVLAMGRALPCSPCPLCLLQSGVLYDRRTKNATRPLGDSTPPSCPSGWT